MTLVKFEYNDCMARSNEQWLVDLQSGGDSQAAALEDLAALVRRNLPFGLAPFLPQHHPEFEFLADDITQETLLRVLDRLHTFEGRSQFTTWVQKIAIRLAFSELRRRRWKDVSLDAGLERDDEPAMPEPADTQAPPETLVERKDLILWLRRLMHQELSQKQKTAIHAVAIQGIPMEEVARKMGMNRNALYKLLHDARKKLKQRVEAAGYKAEAILAVFEEGAK